MFVDFYWQSESLAQTHSAATENPLLRLKRYSVPKKAMIIYQLQSLLLSIVVEYI